MMLLPRLSRGVVRAKVLWIHPILDDDHNDNHDNNSHPNDTHNDRIPEGVYPHPVDHQFSNSVPAPATRTISPGSGARGDHPNHPMPTIVAIQTNRNNNDNDNDDDDDLYYDPS